MARKKAVPIPGYSNLIKKYGPGLAIAYGNTLMARKKSTKSKSKTKKYRQTRLGRKTKSRAPSIYYYRNRKKKLGSRVKNVKADKDGFTKTYFKQKVTRQQQKKINKRFKEGYNPFKSNENFAVVDTIPKNTNSAKYIWQCHNSLYYISQAWRKFYSANSAYVANNLQGVVDTNNAMLAQDQAIYFSRFEHNIEIYNPSNYDMTVIIYDLVCKEDTEGNVSSVHYNANSELESTSAAALVSKNYSNPIKLIKDGLTPQTGPYPDTSQTTSTAQIADPSEKLWYDIETHPSDSYPFNIYWKVVGKRTLRLQPGATHYHRFIHKPKCLMNRGYFFHRFPDSFTTLQSTKEHYRGIKDVTSGVLFKYYGQIAAETTSGQVTEGSDQMDQNYSHVANLSGRLAIKDHYEAKWYCMDSKVSFNFRGGLDWTPTDEEELTVVNDVTIKNADDEIENEETNPYN